jgi:DNA-binding winged helix-turn-helix (wHTH) protein
VEKRGALVTKGELLNAVWPNTFVEENNLTQYVSLLRKTLGDEAEDQKYIQTVPRLGYRLVSDVRLVVDCEPSVLVAKHTHTRVIMREEREEVREEDQELAEVDATGSSLSMPTKLTVTHDRCTLWPRRIFSLDGGESRDRNLTRQGRWRFCRFVI